MSTLSLILSTSLLVGIVFPSPNIQTQPWQTPPMTRAQVEQDRKAKLHAGYALEVMGDLALSDDAVAQAEAFYRRAKAIFENVGDINHLASCSGKLSIVLAEQNKLAASKIEGEEALRHYARKAQPDINKGAILHNLGWIAVQQGDLTAAISRYLEAIQYYESFRNDVMARILGAMSKRSLAKIYFDRCEFAMASKYYRESLAVLERSMRKSDRYLQDVRQEYKAAKTAEANRK